MSGTKRLALIALGYTLAVAGGFAAEAINELGMPSDVSQGSPGMVAFGDMILFVLVTCVLALVPTWFLLRLAMETGPSGPSAPYPERSAIHSVHTPTDRRRIGAALITVGVVVLGLALWRRR